MPRPNSRSDSRPNSRPLAASARLEAGEPDRTLASELVRHGLPLPSNHFGLDLQAVQQVSQALDALRRDPRFTVPEAIREGCISGFPPKFEAVLCLIRQGVIDPDGRAVPGNCGRTLLHEMAIHSTTETEGSPSYVPIDQRIRELVGAGARINSRCMVHWLTPLDHAMLRQEQVVIESLLRHGADRL